MTFEDILKRVDLLNADDILKDMGAVKDAKREEELTSANKINTILLCVGCNELKENLKEYNIVTSGGKNMCRVKFSSSNSKEVLYVHVRANIWKENECSSINSKGLNSLMQHMLANCTYERILKKQVLFNGDRYEIKCSTSYRLNKDNLDIIKIANFISCLFNWMYDDNGLIRIDKNKEMEELTKLRDEDVQRRKKGSISSRMSMDTSMVVAEKSEDSNHDGWVRPKAVLSDYKFKEDEIVKEIY